MVRILHLADLHLGWTPRSLGDRAAIIQKERDMLLEKAVAYALDPSCRIDLVIIAGDLFESHRPDPYVAEQALRGLARLQQAGIFVVTVPGNHDEISYHDSVYRLRGDSWPGLLVRNPMPELVGRTEIRGTPVHLYSLAYTGGVTQANEVGGLPRSSEPGLHVGVFHASLDWDARDRSLRLSRGALAAAGYDYVALGHIHRYQALTAGRSAVVYPGAVEHKGFSDPGTGCLTIAELDGVKVTLDRVPVEVRKHDARQVDATHARSQNDLVRECRVLADPDALVRITLTGSPAFTPNVEALRAALECDFFHVEFVDEMDVVGAETVEAYAAEPTIRGSLVRRLAEKIATTADDRERRLFELALRKGIGAFERGGELK